MKGGFEISMNKIIRTRYQVVACGHVVKRELFIGTYNECYQYCCINDFCHVDQHGHLWKFSIEVI